MKTFLAQVVLCCFVLLPISGLFSQTKSGDVPRVVRYSGTLTNADGSPRVGTIGVSFAIYADDRSTAPLWQEAQNIVVDSDGHYTVLLGVSRSEGLPDGLFATNDARWLGIRVENEAEQPRALLAAVPYALKAADAETLGGRPLSAFVLNESAGGEDKVTAGGSSGQGGAGSRGRIQPLSINPSSTGTQNYLAMWTDGSGTLGNSNVAQSGTNVGIGTTTPNAPLQVGPDFTLSGAWPTMGYNLYYNGGWKYATSGSGSLIQQDYANNGFRMAVAPAGTAGNAASLSDAMFISSTGNVGVGTLAPNAPLQIGPDFTLSGAWPTMGFNLYYSGGWKYATTNSATLVQQDYTNNGLTVSVAPSGTGGTAAALSSALFVAGTGKVGIGTTSPAEKLDVNGNIKASGTISGSNLNATGTTALTGAPTGSNVDQGTLYINPASASAGQTLFGVAVGGYQRMLVDASGNLAAAGGLSGMSLALPNNTSPTSGVITFGGIQFLHNHGDNVFLGSQAGNFGTAGSADIGIGNLAMASITTGNSNTAVGGMAMNSTTTGGLNTAVGYVALNHNVTGSQNVAVGSWALYNNAASYNTALGASAMQLNTAGTSNVAVGYQALNANTTASSNTAVGAAAMASNTSGQSNTALGSGSMSSNATGTNNVAIGAGALVQNVSGNNNIAIGPSALQYNTDCGNTAIGVSAMASFTSYFGCGMSEAANTAVGYSTVGGSNSLAFATTSTSNTAVGYVALAQVTSGGFNTAVGRSALLSNQQGGQNSALGSYALANSSGSYNIAVGFNAGNNATTGNYNIYLGHAGVAAEGNTIRIGDGTNQSKTFIYGIRGTTTVNNDAVAVMVDSAGQLGTVSSSREVKQDIADMGEASGRVMKLRPVTFRYRNPYGDGSKPIQFGLIAEEVAETFPELAATGASGKIETVKYHLLPVLLLNEVQRQEATIRRLSAEVEQLRSERESVADLRRQVEELRALMAQMQSGQK